MSPARRVLHLGAGSPGTIAGAVYGTIVVLAVLAAGGRAFEHDLWRLATLVTSTVLVLWLAHVYAHGLAESLEAERRLDAAELRSIAARELAIPLAAVGPTGVLVRRARARRPRAVPRRDGGVAGARDRRGDARAGAAVRPHGAHEPRGILVSVAVNLALGLAIVALKVAVTH